MRAGSDQGRVEDMHHQGNLSRAAGVCVAPLEAHLPMRGAGGQTSPGRAKHSRAPRAAGRHDGAAKTLPAGGGVPYQQCRRRPPNSPSREKPETPARRSAAPALHRSAGTHGDRVRWRPADRPVATREAKLCESPQVARDNRRTSASTRRTPEKSRSTPRRAVPDTPARTRRRRNGD